MESDVTKDPSILMMQWILMMLGKKIIWDISRFNEEGNSYNLRRRLDDPIENTRRCDRLTEVGTQSSRGRWGEIQVVWFPYKNLGTELSIWQKIFSKLLIFVSLLNLLTGSD